MMPINHTLKGSSQNVTVTLMPINHTLKGSSQNVTFFSNEVSFVW